MLQSIQQRCPRGAATGATIPLKLTALPVGKGRIIQAGEKIAILSLGTRLEAALQAAKMFKEKYNFDISIADARFAKPLDEEMILQLAKEHQAIITLEEGAIGGFSAHVNNLILNQDIKIKNLFYPDIFMDQDSQDNMHSKANLSAEKIFEELSILMESK